jgi:hypothetical protein
MDLWMQWNCGCYVNPQRDYGVAQWIRRIVMNAPAAIAACMAATSFVISNICL